MRSGEQMESKFTEIFKCWFHKNNILDSHPNRFIVGGETVDYLTASFCNEKTIFVPSQFDQKSQKIVPQALFHWFLESNDFFQESWDNLQTFCFFRIWIRFKMTEKNQNVSIQNASTFFSTENIYLSLKMWTKFSKV